MRYGKDEVQIYTINGRELERPRGELMADSVIELVKTLTGNG